MNSRGFILKASRILKASFSLTFMDGLKNWNYISGYLEEKKQQQSRMNLTRLPAIWAMEKQLVQIHSVTTGHTDLYFFGSLHHS